MAKSNIQEARPRSLWHNQNYLLLQSGQIVSYIGNQQQSFALPLLVLTLTRSAIQAGIAVSLSTIAVLVVSPLAGALVDRWDRKLTMLLCDAGRMLFIISIPLAYWFHTLSIWHLYIVVACAGILGTIFNVANTAALPNVVTHEQLPAALSLEQAAYSAIRTLGSLLGAGLYSIGSIFPFLVNALSFAASVFSLSFIRGNFQGEQQSVRQPFFQAISEGFIWLWREPLVRFLTFVSGADALRYGAGYLVILILAQGLHASPGGIGAIFTAAAIGSLLGNIASNWARRRWRFGTIAISMLWLEALMFPLYALAPNIVVMCFIAAAEELVAPIYTISLNTYRLMATPDSMLGRMSSTVQMVMQGSQSLGAILGGILVESLGGKWSAFILAAWLVLLAIATSVNGRVRCASLAEPS